MARSIKGYYPMILKKMADHYRAVLEVDDYNKLAEEMKAFVLELEPHPITRQHEMFMEKYGSFYSMHQIRRQNELLHKIHGKVQFFYVLAIIGLIITALVVIPQLIT